MNKLFTLFIAASAALSAQAQTANTRILELAKQTVVEQFGMQKAAAAQQMVVEDRIDGNISIVSAKGAGTVFVGRQNSQLQVVGCSETPYTKDMQLPDGLRWWLSQVSSAMSSQELLAPLQPAAVAPADVNSFIKTRWGQEKPYNGKTPKINLKNTPTGCTATAMAQIMNYYRYPEHGTGDCHYSITKTVGGKVTTENKTATLSDSYDWANIIDDYTLGYTAAQSAAISTLMRDCGYATAMDYGREGSAATLWEAAHGMAYNMQYDSLALQVCVRAFYTDAQWSDMVYAQLNNRRPILYAGYDPTGGGGHAFVFDGVRPDGQVHINWGWEGSMNGFYDFTLMNHGANFVEEQQMLVGFKPEPTSSESKPDYTPAIYLAIPELTADGTTLNFSGGLFNYDWHFFCGDAVMVMTHLDSGESLPLYFFLEEVEDEQGNTQPMYVAPLYGYAFGSAYGNEDLCLNDYFCEESDPRFTPGDYMVEFYCRASFEEEFRPCSMVGGESWLATFTVAADGAITITDPTAITTITADKASTRTYNLAGQLLTTPHRGIIIQGGKKMLQK